MNKKGFTLIEILGVITLLALLSTIIILSVNKSLKESKKTLDAAQIENIRSAASMWRTDNIEYIPDDGYFTIFLSTLQNSGYIDNEIINPNNNETFDKNIIIKIGINDIIVGNEIDVESIDDYMLALVNSEINILNEKITDNTYISDGIYYFNSNGNLEKNGNIIYLNSNGDVKGNILIHNHKFISGCIQYNNYNYDYYKGTLTKYNYPCSTTRGENLVINGDLSYRDNTNFNTLTYNNGGYLSRADVNNGTTILSSNNVPIDIENSYQMDLTVRSNNPLTRYYFGFVESDIDKNTIFKYHISTLNNTFTTLAQDLKNGDEYIYLTDMSNWNNTATQKYQRGFIFWNYSDSTGYQYPELTYSRNVWSNLYTNDNIDLENNRIKLTNPWNHGTFIAGTKLSQTNDGNTYRYALAANITLSNEWNDLTKILSGIGTQDNAKFSIATKYIKFLALDNYNAQSNVTTDYKKIYIREVIN